MIQYDINLDFFLGGGGGIVGFAISIPCIQWGKPVRYPAYGDTEATGQSNMK